jgi:hypothetical protein
MQSARTTAVLASTVGHFFRDRRRGTVECIFLAGPAQQKLFRQHFDRGGRPALASVILYRPHH